MKNEHKSQGNARARRKELANELNAFKRIFFEENGRKPAQADYEASPDIAAKLTEFIRLDGKAVPSSVPTSKAKRQKEEARAAPPMSPTFHDEDDDAQKQDLRNVTDDNNNNIGAPQPAAVPTATEERQMKEASYRSSRVKATTWIRSLERHHSNYSLSSNEKRHDRRVYCPVTRCRVQHVVRSHNTHAKFAAFIALHFPDFSPLGGNRQDLAVVGCAALSIYSTCYRCPSLRQAVPLFLPRDVLEHTLAVLCVPPTATTDEEYLLLQSQSVDRVVPLAQHMVLPRLQFVCRLQFNDMQSNDQFSIPFDKPKEIERNYYGWRNVVTKWAYRRLRLEVDMSRVSHHGTAQTFSSDAFLRELTDIDRHDENEYNYDDERHKHKKRSLKSVLTRIILPDTLVDTGNDGFLSRCPMLKQLHIGHLSQLTRIGDAFLKDCVSLRSIQLPSSVVEIGRQFMAGCLAVSYVDLRHASRMTRIGDYFLDNCVSLHRVELPPCVTAVGHRFLNGCHDIAALDISNTYPALTRLGDGFLNNCHKIHTVKLPPSVSIIGHQFMSFCTEVKEVDLQSLTLTRIADGFLNNCHNLTRADLPTTLSEVGHRFINCCSSVEELDLSALPDLVRVGDLCLNNCHSLARLTLPMSLAEVGHHFLNCCTQLEDVNLTDMPIKVIGDDCFSGCRSLTRIQLPVSLVHVGHQFLGGCSAIEELDFHATRQLVRIGNGFLRNCVSLRSLQGLDLRKLHQVGVDFLRGCRSLKARKMLQTSVLKKVSTSISADDAEKQSQMEARKQQLLQQQLNKISEQQDAARTAAEAKKATTDELAQPSSPAPPAWVMLRQHGLVAQGIHLSLLAVLEAIIDALDVVPLVVPPMSSVSPSGDGVVAAAAGRQLSKRYIGDSGIGIGNGNNSRRKRCKQRHHRRGCIQTTTTTTTTAAGRDTTIAVAEKTSIRPIHTTPTTKTAAAVVGQQQRLQEKHRSMNGKKRGFFECNQRASQLRETTRVRLLSVKLAHEVHAKRIFQLWKRPIEERRHPFAYYKLEQNIAQTLQLLCVEYEGASAVIWRTLLQIVSAVGRAATNDEEMAAPAMVGHCTGPGVRVGTLQAKALLQQTLKYAAPTRRLADALDTAFSEESLKSSSSSSNLLQPWLSCSGTPFSFLFSTNNTEEEEEEDEDDVDDNHDTNIPRLILRSVKVLRHMASQFREIVFTHRACTSISSSTHSTSSSAIPPPSSSPSSPPFVECGDDDAIKCCVHLADRLEQLAACLVFAVTPASTDAAGTDQQTTTSSRADSRTSTSSSSADNNEESEGTSSERSASDDESGQYEEEEEEDRSDSDYRGGATRRSNDDKTEIEEDDYEDEDADVSTEDSSDENNGDIDDVDDYDWFLTVADRWLNGFFLNRRKQKKV